MCMGYTFMLRDEDLFSIVDVRSKYCEPDMPTLHISERQKVLTLSVSSGVLIRPVRLRADGNKFTMEGLYVDTMMFLKKTFSTAEKEPGQLASAIALMIPFYRFAMKPKTGIVQLAEKGDATISINGYNNPIMMTAVARTRVNNESEDCTVVILGRNMVMAFINIQQDTEDACVVSKEFAESG
ncbi:hypothetical protein ColTof4_13575 [Colletotrichum tofieldiae]|nr:hypothetical protein ColTof4_13575 [Colletotrichum tofieldiae]